MSVVSEAEDKIMKAKTGLVIKHPFFATIALGMPFCNATEAGMPIVKTMATDGRRCFWDENFVNGLTVNQCVGVCAHEVLHVVYQHPMRRGDRDWKIWNIACDAAINWIVIDAGMELPEDKIWLPQYRNWMVEAIYDDMIQNGPPPIHGDFPVPVPGGGGDQQKEKQPGKSKQPGQPSNEQSQDDGGGQSDQPDDEEAQQSDGEGNQPGGQPGQSKQPWGGIMEPRKDDGSEMSSAEIDELVEEIKVKVLQAAEAAKSVGKLPGALQGLVKAAAAPTINWKEYIQQWVAGRIPDDYTWRKPNRKMLGLYNIITPSMQMNGSGVGVLSVDNSGSVSNRELIQFVNEIVGVIELCNPAKLYIIQHDSRVEKVDEWEPGDEFDGLVIKGRGGTNITPVFKYCETDIDEEINWMVCFTDMEIMDFPPVHKAPEYPVLWAATGKDCAPFGTYINIRNPLDVAA